MDLYLTALGKRRWGIAALVISLLYGIASFAYATNGWDPLAGIVFLTAAVLVFTGYALATPLMFVGGVFLFLSALSDLDEFATSDEDGGFVAIYLITVSFLSVVPLLLTWLDRCSLSRRGLIDITTGKLSRETILRGNPATIPTRQPELATPWGASTTNPIDKSGDLVPGLSTIDARLSVLDRMHARGSLTDAEFTEKRSRVLSEL